MGSDSVIRRCRLRCPVWPKANASLRQIDPLNPLFPHPSRSTSVAPVADDAAEPLVLGKQVFQQATRDELIEQLPQRQQETLRLVFADEGRWENAGWRGSFLVGWWFSC